ncbi:MAG: hypothetical protein H7321_04115 [Bacteroidia bacterium]|nr:hypothetical protein [Bacteroidia bacterium]
MKNKIIIVGILLHIIAAIFSVGHYHPDEHFQILEFAGFKAGISPASDLAWEFHNAIRPALQPLAAFIFYEALGLFGKPDPFIWVMVLRFFSVTLSIAAAAMVYKTFIKGKMNEKAEIVFWAFTLLFWCMPYTNARFSSENISGSLFAMSIAAFPYTSKKTRSVILAGLLAGLSLVVRYQFAFMIAGFGLWIIIFGKFSLRQILIYSFSVIFVLLAGVIIDYWFYGKWVFTLWEYFSVNIIQNKAAEFGIEPWYYYFSDGINKFFLPFGILILYAFALLVTKKKKHVLTWILLPFLLGHIAVGHKELRFVFPLLHFVPLMMCIVFVRYQVKIEKLILKKPIRITGIILFVINILMAIAVSFQPANKRVLLLKHLYNESLNDVSFAGENPYKDVHWFNVYMKDTSVKSMKPFNDMHPSKRVIVNHYEWKKDGYYRMYSQLPPFAESVNVNDWLGRTEFWSVYQK